jgi:hypothetical protein
MQSLNINAGRFAVDLIAIEFSKHLEAGRLVWGIPLALPEHQSKAQAPSVCPLSGSIERETTQDKTRH